MRDERNLLTQERVLSTLAGYTSTVTLTQGWKRLFHRKFLSTFLLVLTQI